MVHIFSDYDTNEVGQVTFDVELSLSELSYIKKCIDLRFESLPRKIKTTELIKAYQDLAEKIDKIYTVEYDHRIIND